MTIAVAQCTVGLLQYIAVYDQCHKMGLPAHPRLQFSIWQAEAGFAEHLGWDLGKDQGLFLITFVQIWLFHEAPVFDVKCELVLLPIMRCHQR